MIVILLIVVFDRVWVIPIVFGCVKVVYQKLLHICRITVTHYSGPVTANMKVLSDEVEPFHFWNLHSGQLAPEHAHMSYQTRAA